MIVSKQRLDVKITVFVLALSTVFCAAPAYAQKLTRPDVQESNAPEKVAPEKVVNFSEITTDIEGAGLFKRPAEGSLGRDLWEGVSRDTARRMLNILPVSSRDPAVQKLIFGMLLTHADTSALLDKALPKAGEDFLTLRLKKLIEAGAYRQALELYSGLNLDAPPPSVARAGILAMLFNGQKSLACVEYKTTLADAAPDDFSKDIDAYCTLETKPAPYLYEATKFSALGLEERAKIAGENMVAMVANTDRDFKKIPPQDLQILVRASGLSDEERYILNLRAVEWGLVSAAEFAKSYRDAIDPDERLDPALQPPVDAAAWQKLPYFLQMAANRKSDSEKWPVLRAALPLAAAYGPAALLPFTDALDEIRPADVTSAEQDTIIAVFRAAAAPFPRYIIEKIEKNPSASSEFGLMAAAYISRQKGQRDEADLKVLEAAQANASPQKRLLVKKLIETIDNSKDRNHNDHDYENGKDLTFVGRYVMPTQVVWERLKKSGDDRLMTEVVSLTAVLLQSADPGEVYPEVLGDALQGLMNVGLGDIASSLAITAAVGGVEIKN